MRKTLAKPAVAENMRKGDSFPFTHVFRDLRKRSALISTALEDCSLKMKERSHLRREDASSKHGVTEVEAAAETITDQ